MNLQEVLHKILVIENQMLEHIANYATEAYEKDHISTINLTINDKGKLETTIRTDNYSSLIIIDGKIVFDGTDIPKSGVDMIRDYVTRHLESIEL